MNRAGQTSADVLLRFLLVPGRTEEADSTDEADRMGEQFAWVAGRL